MTRAEIIERLEKAEHQRQPSWPLGGYAPGKYLGKCRECQTQMWEVDKYATQCLPCAVSGVKRSLELYRKEVSELKEENEAFRKVFRALEAKETGNG